MLQTSKAKSSATSSRADLKGRDRTEHYLLLCASKVLIAFVTACTHGTVVASFSEGNASLLPADIIYGPGAERRHKDEEEAYWRVDHLNDTTERRVLSCFWMHHR